MIDVNNITLIQQQLSYSAITLSTISIISTLHNTIGGHTLILHLPLSHHTVYHTHVWLLIGMGCHACILSPYLTCGRLHSLRILVWIGSNPVVLSATKAFSKSDGFCPASICKTLHAPRIVRAELTPAFCSFRGLFNIISGWSCSPLLCSSALLSRYIPAASLCLPSVHLATSKSS